MTVSRLPNAITFAGAAAFTSLFVVDFCAAIFGCGCLPLWSGADAHCNIHQAGTRHCPWCAQGLAASAVPWALIVAVQAAISFWPRPIPAAVRAVSALAAFPVAGGVLALAYGIAAEYWK